jgi:DNA-binding GntR family transcriptional regulator
MGRPASNRRRNGASIGTLDDGAPFAERVYAQLRQAILDGHLKAGERMREFDLAEQFGVSRTPVREALKKLAVEGLVVDMPGRGLVITEPSPNEILDAYLVREMLEGLAARLAADRATETDRIHLTAVLRQIQNAIAAGADQQAITLSNEFDRLLFGATRSRRLSHMIEFARASQGRLLRLSLQYPGRLAQSAEERAEILQAIHNRDPEAAEQATRQHLRRARETRIAQSLEDGSWLESMPHDTDFDVRANI